MSRRNKNKGKKVVIQVTNKTKKSKKKSRSRGKMSQMLMAPKGAMGFAMDVCSITNPFCPQAIGAKYPDGSLVRTLVFTVNGKALNLSSNASGEGAVAFLGGVNQVMGSSSITGGVPTWTNPTPNYAPFPSTPYRFRIVSWGVRLSNIASPMTAAGVVRIRLYSPLTFAGMMNTATGVAKSDIADIFADAVFDVALPKMINEDVFIVSKPIGDNARLFIQPDTATLTGWTNPGWQVIQIGLSGCPNSTACIQASLFYHYEYIAAEGDSTNSFSTPGRADSPVVKAAGTSVLQQVGNFVEGTLSKVESVFESKAGRLVGAALAGYATKSPGTALALYAGSGRGSNYRPPNYMPGMEVN